MKKILILLVGCLCVSACTDYQANKYYEAAQQQEQQYDWATAEGIYSELLNKFPQSKIAAQANLAMKECIKKKEEIESLSRECDDLVSKKDYERAVNKLEELLKLDMTAGKKEQMQEVLDSTKLQLADVYYAKKGNKNKQKAFALFKEAAEKGNAYAQYSTGFMLQNGQGTKTNYKEAEEWYRKAAEQGEDNAINAVKKIEEARALDIKTADRKSYKIYHLLGKNVSDVLRSTGGNYDEYKESFLDGNSYMCYYFGGQMVGGYRDGFAHYGGYQSDVLYICHNQGSKTIVGVGYRWPHRVMNVSNLPKIQYELPKSFLNLKYESEYGNSVYSVTRIYTIKNEKWRFYTTEDMNDDIRVIGTSIFLQ